MAQEPPLPSPIEPPEVIPSSLLFVSIGLLIALIICIKYKAFLDFLFILSSTLAGFFIGMLWYSPISIGFAMACSFAGLMTSAAIDFGIRVIARIWKSK